MVIEQLKNLIMIREIIEKVNTHIKTFKIHHISAEVKSTFFMDYRVFR